MADFATALRARLIADAAVSAVTTQIHWGQVPQGKALPYVRLTVVSDPRPEHLKGYDSARQVRVQASIFSQNYGQARQLGAKIIRAVQNPWSAAGGKVGRVKGEGPTDGPSDDSPDGLIHHQIVQLMAEHTFDD